MLNTSDARRRSRSAQNTSVEPTLMKLSASIGASPIGTLADPGTCTKLEPSHSEHGAPVGAMQAIATSVASMAAHALGVAMLT